MASRTLNPPLASRAADPVERALEALLDELAPLAAPILVAHRGGEHTVWRVRAEMPEAVRTDLLDGDRRDSIADVGDSSGGTWTRVALETGGDSCVVVAASGPLDAVDRVRLESAGFRAVRRIVLDRERRAGDRLRQLLVTARRAVASLDLDEVLAAIVRDATQLLHGQSGDMLLLDRERNTLRVVALWNFPPDMLGFELRRGQGLSWETIRRRRSVQVEDYGAYEQRAPGLERYDFGAVLCSPMVFRDDAIGTLNVHAGEKGKAFSDADTELLTAFASHAAIAIDHARRYENEVRLGKVLADTNRELTRSLAVQQRLAEQVILDRGPAGIADVLARDLGRHVVIEDHLHRTIAGASPDAGDDWRRLSVRGSAPVGLQPHAGGREPFSVAVRVGRDVVGHLLLSDEGELGEIDRALVDIAVTGVALEFAKIRAAIEVEERLRGEAVTDLLTGTYPSPDAIAGRAARLGYDLAQPRDVLVVDVGRAEPAGAVRPGDTPEVAGNHEARWLAAIRERLAVRHPRSIAVVQAGSIVVLATRGRAGADDGRALADDLRRAVEAAGVTGPVTIAIGRRCDRPDAYAPAYREAREALDLMLKLGRAGTTIGAPELGPYALLLRATSREDLEAFARRALDPLIAHDVVHGAELLRTLRVHLEEDRVQRRTAARCFIHVNTVVYRVRRIEELLGVTLDDAQAVFDLTLALRILDMLDLPAATPR